MKAQYDSETGYHPASEPFDWVYWLGVWSAAILVGILLGICVSVIYYG